MCFNSRAMWMWDMSIRKLFAALVTIGLCVARIPSALAVPVDVQNYRLDVIFSKCFVGASLEGTACALTDPVHAGVTYSGRFSIDASVLSTDGYKDVGFESFYFALGSTVWDSSRPYPDSDYSGSRFNNPSTGAAGFGPWTLLVQDGELAGICCGVFGISDFPWMDLYNWGYVGDQGPIAFANVTGLMDPRFTGYTRSFFAQGAFSIHRIPEPSTLVLLSLALVMLAFETRRRSSRHHFRSRMT